MQDFKIFDAEYKLMNIIWESEPINSTELVKICSERLDWKKPTTYTVLRKLCERGILKNDNAIVSSLIKREQAQKYESESLLNKSFNGSVPIFLATFLKGKKLNEKEAAEIKKMIEEATK